MITFESILFKQCHTVYSLDTKLIKMFDIAVSSEVFLSVLLERIEHILCDMIKRNESDVGDVVFEILGERVV